jgi:hypothetical protein
MTRKSYVQIEGVLYEKGTEPIPRMAGYPAILGDLPDFVSPIDGKVVKGRAGLRDHCARHNVVPTADLKGLPMGRPAEVKPNKAEVREAISRVMYQKGYLR